MRAGLSHGKQVMRFAEEVHPNMPALGVLYQFPCSGDKDQEAAGPQKLLLEHCTGHIKYQSTKATLST